MDTTTLPAAQTSTVNPDLIFLSASTLAANGRLEEATAILSPDGRPPSTPQGLDLLARIAVHSGDLNQARKLWEAALQAEPSYEPARRALQLLHTPWFALAVAKRIALLIIAAAAGCLALVGLLALLQPVPAPAPSAQVHVTHRARSAPASPVAPSQSRPPGPTPAASTNDSAQALKSLERSIASQSDQLADQISALKKSQTQLAEAQERMTQQLATLAASHQTLSAQQATSQQLTERTRRDLLSLVEAYANDHRPVTNSPAAPESPPPLALDVPGATLHHCATGWEIRFDAPLFDRDSHFKIGSKALITSVARALVRTQEKLTICVVAFADSELPTWPWSKPLTDASLGRIRADRVKAVIDHLSVIPSGALSATNGSPADLPYPGEGLRNRTAVLRISRR